MKTFLLTALFLTLSLSLVACAIPDMPGPIGIPGIEAEPLTLKN